LFIYVMNNFGLDESGPASVRAGIAQPGSGTATARQACAATAPQGPARFSRPATVTRVEPQASEWSRAQRGDQVGGRLNGDGPRRAVGNEPEP
jgi:hypothetical protein